MAWAAPGVGVATDDAMLAATARGRARAFDRKPARLDARPMGVLVVEHMDREQLVDRMGAKAPPDSPKPKVDKRAFRTAGTKGPPAPSTWLKPLADYDRRQPREYHVTRFG